MGRRKLKGTEGRWGQTGSEHGCYLAVSLGRQPHHPDACGLPDSVMALQLATYPMIMARSASYGWEEAVRPEEATQSIGVTISLAQYSCDPPDAFVLQ
jgi:hypothetical protein